ncbi:MAG: hypothetical protein OCC45_00155 [Desulfotalea sp.]
MHIGGFHIFVGLFFVVVCSALTAFLLKAIYWLWIKSRYGAYKLNLFLFSLQVRNGERGNPDFKIDEKIRPIPPKGKAWNKKWLIKLFIFFLTINMGIYLFERIKYLGDDNLHYKAKEYWIAGQVVAKTRKVLGMVLHPENPILVPYILLHKSIYHIGKRYLPYDDGEIYVWYGSWFLHPYAQRIKRPYGVISKRPSPKMAGFVEEFYNTMKNTQTRTIGDKDIYRKSLFDFPFLAFYYSTFNGFTFGRYIKSGERVRTNKLASGRLIELLSWLDQVKIDWKNEGLSEAIWEDEKYLASIMQLTTLGVLQDIALSLPSRGEFTCDHSIIRRMKEEYQNIMSTDPAVNSLVNLGKKSYGEKAYQTIVFSVRGSTGKYFISDVCKKEMPQEQYLFFKRKSRKVGPGWDMSYQRSSVESVFATELRPLMFYFYHTKDAELFCGEAMAKYSDWQKVKRKKGEKFTQQEHEDHELILQGIDEMCLEKAFINEEERNRIVHCDLYLDRYLYLLDPENNNDMSLPILKKEKAMEILDARYKDCSKRRDEITQAQKRLAQ